MEKTIRINLIWVIAILLLVIASLLLKIPNGSYVADYISFAASLASLILAVVAIFYSIISNQSFYQSISSLTKLAEQIQVDSEKINNTGDEFLARATDLLAEVSNVPMSVEQMATRLDEKISSLFTKSEAPSVLDGEKKADTTFFPKSTIGGNIALYLIAMSYEHKKPFEIDKIFSVIPLRSYIHGFIHSLSITSYRGLNISFSNKHHEVNDVGEMNPSSIIKQADGRKGTLWAKARSEIEAYFAVGDEAS